jgi:hypothetical protein
VLGDFVIQLRMDGESPVGQIRGRIEHIDSGDSGSFQNLEELGALIVRILAEVKASKGGKC